MKILIISDTHGNIIRAKEVIEKMKDEIDIVFHLGDTHNDAVNLSLYFRNINFESIYGNCDYFYSNESVDKLLEYHGKRFLLTHGHRDQVKYSLKKLHKRAVKDNLDMILFGHTHMANKIICDNYTLLNPGSIAYPRDNKSESYAIIDIEKGDIKTKIYYLEKK